jgi:hypothetical protein
MLCAVSASYDPEARAIDIRLNNGVVAAIPIGMAGLDHVAPADLKVLVIEGRGYGLRIPALDIDLSIPILFEEAFGGTSMKRAQGRAAASSRNGRLGGRPKKKGAAVI